MKQDKCFQILKMMTDKMHSSLNTVSNNVFKLCALLAVQPIYLDTVQRSPTPVTRQSVSHEILDLFQWSTTIEQELAHIITTLAASRQSGGTWPLERKLSKYPCPSPATDCNYECNKRNSISSVTSTAWLDDLLDNPVMPAESHSTRPHSHPSHQSHQHVYHPHHHPHHPLFHMPQHQYHFPHHPNHSHTCPNLPSSNSPNLTFSSASPNSPHTKNQRTETTTPKRLTERLTDRLSFRRKRTIPTLDTSVPESDLATSTCTLNDSCMDSDTHFTIPASSCDDNTPPTTPSAHGFTSDDEASLPPFSPSSPYSPSTVRKKRSGPVCFDSPQPASEEMKDKGKVSTWRLWSKSTGNSTDEEIAVSTRRRGTTRKTKFRLRLFDSKASEIHLSQN